ncbi:MAG: DUF5597 domain-containing protein, partial [Treponema sp.]|nr:DUF5597 domain-containing protein [Treponema sp.]
MMAYIKEIDEKEDTVIMIQIENEPGLMGTDMCYCEKCQSLYSDNLTPEQFTASLIRDYVDAVAGAAKSVCALPMYTNVWLSEGPASMPGLNYPSGGAVPSMLEVWLGKIRNLDFIAPDIYQYSYRRFNEICADYSANGNTLFIAETSSGLHGRQEKNVFYALGCHGAIGFDPWSIDIPFPNQNESPMVDPVDQTWGPQAYILRDSYLAIRDSMPAITAARKSSNLVTFVQEEGEHGTSFVLNDVLFSIGYESNARGMIIGFGSGEFIALGAGFRITPKKPYPSGESIKFRSLFRGRFVDGIWCNINPVIRETTFSDSAALRTAGVMRFKL